ncbi:MAG: methionine--tRNA ligase [Fimbriimonadaceae bacterium]
MPEITSITTPIYYVNSVPHIGTMLTTLAADVTARYRRMRGEKVLFLTGTDENGLKVKEAAEAAGKDPQAFVDAISDQFRVIWRGMNFSVDDFIRTTEPRHRRAVEEVWVRLRDKGYLYADTYKGWYDVSSETFYKESDLVDGKSPDGNDVRWVEEENWFFRLSAFEDRLLAHIETHPNFIIPESRKNEVVSFIRQGLRDTCVTRANPGWGIPVPGDPEKVVYVWFDALVNYLAASGWPDDPHYTASWPNTVEWMGKDILTRFHATLWPAMLMGLEVDLPETLVGHAWMLMGGEKISKSKGNVVAPLDLARDLAEKSGCSFELAVDAVRYASTAAMPFENDGVWTLENFDRTYNSDLANDLGNALNRTIAIISKFAEGRIPDAEPEAETVAACERAKAAFEEAMAGYRVDRAAHAALDVIRFLNKYIDTRAPWALAKASDAALPGVLRGMALCLRTAEGLIRPIMPTTADAIADQMALTPVTVWDEVGRRASAPGGATLGSPKPMFPRLESAKIGVAPTTEAPEPEKPKKPAKGLPEPASEVDIEEFFRLNLRVARILEAEPVEGSDKLLKLQVMVGSEKRQVVAGIRSSYSPEDLIGLQVVLVANLKPAKIRGLESQGMLLAADDGEGAILVSPERESPEGVRVR